MKPNAKYAGILGSLEWDICILFLKREFQNGNVGETELITINVMD